MIMCISWSIVLHKCQILFFYSRLPFEKSDDEDLIGIQTDIEEVLLKLQVLSDLYSLEVMFREREQKYLFRPIFKIENDLFKLN